MTPTETLCEAKRCECCVNRPAVHVSSFNTQPDVGEVHYCDVCDNAMPLAALCERIRENRRRSASQPLPPADDPKRALEPWLCECGNSGAVDSDRITSVRCERCGLVHMFAANCGNGWPLARGDTVVVDGSYALRKVQQVVQRFGVTEVWLTDEYGTRFWLQPHQMRKVANRDSTPAPVATAEPVESVCVECKAPTPLHRMTVLDGLCLYCSVRVRGTEPKQEPPAEPIRGAHDWFVDGDAPDGLA